MIKPNFYDTSKLLRMFWIFFVKFYQVLQINGGKPYLVKALDHKLENFYRISSSLVFVRTTAWCLDLENI